MRSSYWCTPGPVRFAVACVWVGGAAPATDLHSRVASGLGCRQRSTLVALMTARRERCGGSCVVHTARSEQWCASSAACLQQGVMYRRCESVVSRRRLRATQNIHVAGSCACASSSSVSCRRWRDGMQRLV
eukprot:6210430-Pleurochrysis_carterae.AAC.1